jgi:DGQHR domain-containing protein
MVTLRMASLKQDARELYVGALRAEDVIRLGRVAEWKEDSDEGYQRAPESTRISKLATFLKNESVPLLPSSVLLSHRGTPLPKTEIGPGLYEIKVPDHEVLWIVDGQHRIKGLELAIQKYGLERFKEFQLPVVLMEFDDITEEAHQFQLINENMKKVNTMLARRLLQMRMEKGGAEARKAIRESRRLWEADSVEVIKALTSEPGSVWYGKVQPPNERKRPEHVVRELSFSTSLRPLLTDDLTRDLTVEKVADYLASFWNAWREMMPEVFESPDDYVIQKSPGIFILHQVAKYVLRLLVSRNVTSPTVEDIRLILEDAGEAAQPEYWRTGNTEGAALAGSMGGFKMVADIIIETLQDNGQTI